MLSLECFASSPLSIFSLVILLHLDWIMQIHPLSLKIYLPLHIPDTDIYLLFMKFHFCYIWILSSLAKLSSYVAFYKNFSAFPTRVSISLSISMPFLTLKLVYSIICSTPIIYSSYRANFHFPWLILFPGVIIFFLMDHHFLLWICLK